MASRQKSLSLEHALTQRKDLRKPTSPSMQKTLIGSLPFQKKQEYKLQDLLDIDQFKALQDRLSAICPFPSAIIDIDGNILTATAWQDICTIFHCDHQGCEKECIKNNAFTQEHLQKANPAKGVQCPMGMTNHATPIIIDGIHYGNFFTGQFFLKQPDLEFFRKHAKKNGFNEKAYLEAVKRVPVWSRNQLDNYLFFIELLMEVVTSSGVKKVKEIEIRKKIEENEERAGVILNQMLDGFWIIRRQDGKIIDVNQAMCQMLGYTRDEMLKLAVADVDALLTPEEIRQRILQTIRDGSMRFQSSHRRKDGEVINVDVSATYLPESDLIFGFHRDITERKQAAVALSHSHNLLSYIIEHNRSAVAVHDRDMNYIYVSQRYLDDYKITEQDIIGKHHYEVFPDLPQKWRDVHQRVLKGEVLSADDDLYLKQDGSLEWTRWECRPWYETDGSIGGLIVYTEVITDRKRAEEALHAMTTKLETIIKVSPLAICMLDLEGNVQLWNPAAETMFGWRAEEILGKPNPIVSAGMQDEYKRLSMDVLTGSPVINQETVRQCRDGSLIDVSLSSAPVFDLSGNLAGRMAIFTDITERKRVAEALSKSEEHYRTLFENAPIGILSIDSIGNILEVNPRALGILGSPSVQQTKAINFLTSPLLVQVGASKSAIQCFETGKSISAETAYTSKWGRQMYLAYQMIPIFDDNQQTILLQLILEDITERKHREYELQAIAALSAAMRTAPTRDEMLPVIVEQAIGLLDCDAISIEIIESQTGDVVVEAAQGMWETLKGSRQGQGTGLNAIISQTLKPFSTHDMENDPGPFYNQWARKGIRGCAGVPLVAQGSLIGFIWAGRRMDITEAEVELLCAIADIAANAIHRATLHELTQKDATALARAYDTTLEGWAYALELRDQETEGHTRRVVERTLILARRMGVPEDKLENIRRGALLHDIGKMGIPDSILLKPGSLNEREWETMRLHPQYAYKLLKRIDYLRPALDIPYCHHEKWDGTGYPRQLKGEDIPLAARIFAVVDVWDALSNDRIYRPAWSREAALDYIRQQSGRHFDPCVVDAFLKLINDLPVE